MAGVRPALVPEAHGAYGSGRRLGGGDPQRVRLERVEQQRLGERVRLAPGIQIRVRQPRHDQPVLRSHPVRDPGRVQTARLLLPVDRLGKQQRPPDGQRDEHRHHQRRRRDRGRADRPARLQRAHRRSAQEGHPGGLLQRRRATQQAPLLHRPGTETGRRTDGRPDRQRSRFGRRGAVHRNARLGQPAAPHRRRGKGDQGLRCADHDPHRGDRHLGRRNRDQLLLGRPRNDEGHVRRRRREHRSARESHAETRPAVERGQGRWVRPHRKRRRN